MKHSCCNRNGVQQDVARQLTTKALPITVAAASDQHLTGLKKRYTRSGFMSFLD